MTKSSRALTLLLFVVLSLAALSPIRSYDYFWHLATGRWIVEHRALPATDPFAVGSDRKPWINGEWLFEVALYGAHELVGVTGISVLRALFVGALFAFLYWRTKNSFLTAVGFAGAASSLEARPSTMAAMFVAIALSVQSTVAHAVLTVVWINVHPSALIAPVIAALATRRAAPAIASALALLVNPHGWRAVAAPLELMLFVRSGAFVNAEWLPSSPVAFPLLYLTIIGAAVLFAMAENRREHLGRMALATMFAALAISGVRHQALWYVAMPLLSGGAAAASAAGSFAMFRRPERPPLHLVAALIILFVGITTPHGIGLVPRRFPLQAAERLATTRLPGHIYNADQFGGYLIWRFYPQRRVLTDGRNELYHTLIPEYARARLDERAWRALLKKYRIDLAVDEYRPPQRVLDFATKQERLMPASLAYWPRREWALIGYDDVAMVFARRAAFRNEELERWEIRGVVPDAR